MENVAGSVYKELLTTLDVLRSLHPYRKTILQ